MNRLRPELQAAPPGAIVALPRWEAVDFISDLHLHASEPLTFAAWQRYMAMTSADAVFILGDLFEVWVGDDAAGCNAHREGPTPEDTALDADAGFEAQCAAILRQTASRIPVFFMRGNRDFLVGPAFMAQCGCTLLDDPTVLDFGGMRWLLSHGDALCLADTEYLKFRAMVRGDDWQQNFLAKPLAERRSIARALRSQSEARKQSGVTWIDVDTGAAITALRNAGASHMIHGHTHQPANHPLQPGMQRSVLSDWDLAAATPRAEVLRVRLAANHPAVTGPGASIRRIAPDQAWAK